MRQKAIAHGPQLDDVQLAKRVVDYLCVFLDGASERGMSISDLCRRGSQRAELLKNATMDGILRRVVKLAGNRARN